MNHAALPYRRCAGIMLVDRAGRVFVGQRLDTTTEAWQMPQGGVDDGETDAAAAMRELGEETGIAPEHVELVAEAPHDLRYDLPENLVGKVWKGRYRGQLQRWFLYRFLGQDSDIDIATAHPEFRSWRWIEPTELPMVIVPFKRDLYEQVLAAFADHVPATKRAADEV